MKFPIVFVGGWLRLESHIFGRDWFDHPIFIAPHFLGWKVLILRPSLIVWPVKNAVRRWEFYDFGWGKNGPSNKWFCLGSERSNRVTLIVSEKCCGVHWTKTLNFDTGFSWRSLVLFWRGKVYIHVVSVVKGLLHWWKVCSFLWGQICWFFILEFFTGKET